MKIYVVSLYECYALDGFIKHIGYTKDESKAKRICAEYETSDEYYAIYKGVEEIENEV